MKSCRQIILTIFSKVIYPVRILYSTLPRVMHCVHYDNFKVYYAHNRPVTYHWCHKRNARSRNKGHHSIFHQEETCMCNPHFLSRCWVRHHPSGYMSLLIHQPKTSVIYSWGLCANQSIHGVINSKLQVLVDRLVMSPWRA